VEAQDTDTCCREARGKGSQGRVRRPSLRTIARFLMSEMCVCTRKSTGSKSERTTRKPKPQNQKRNDQQPRVHIITNKYRKHTEQSTKQT
jgi:hypothetical protein